MYYFTFPVLTIVGLVGLVAFMFFDFKKNKISNIFRRTILYSFIFYLIVVSHLTIGYLNFPVQESPIRIQLLPFSFINDWIISSYSGAWFFWNSVKLTFYNFIMMLPMGMYLVILFNISFKKGVSILFLTTLLIETLQLILTYFGLVYGRGFNVDDLIMNTLGGALGILIAKQSLKIFYNKYGTKSLDNVTQESSI